MSQNISEDTTSIKTIILKITDDLSTIHVEFGEKSRNFILTANNIHKIVNPKTNKTSLIVNYDKVESKYVSTWFGFGPKKLEKILYTADAKFTDFDAMEFHYRGKIFYDYDSWHCAYIGL